METEKIEKILEKYDEKRSKMRCYVKLEKNRGKWSKK